MARTTALTKIERTLYEQTFYKVIQGGQGAGKTYAIMTLLVGYCESYPDAKVTVVGVSYNHLKDGAISDFKNIMKETNRWDDTKWNKSELFFAFKNGSELQFRSFDKISGRGPRRDVVYVNEADALTYETFGNIANRSKDFAIIDFNPVAKFWAHTELVEKQSKRTSFLILNFEDNEALPPQERDNIESHRPLPGEKPSNWWLVYGLGQIGSLEGNIYHGWEQTTSDHIRQVGKLVRYGLDFGFSNDETALVALYEMPDGKTGLIELIYQRGLLGSQYAGALEKAGVDPNILIVADSARPEIIAEIKTAGFRIIGADKAPGSVLRGIDYVSQRQIVYAGDNLRREYLSYPWRKKRSGEVLDEPQDGNDHCMDAIRYAIADLHRPTVAYGGVR
jgi:phage terminase large subunit